MDAGDISAVIVEILDGDGAQAVDAPAGTFGGDAYCCDANADTIICAGDLSCTILTSFNGQGSCGTS